MTCIKFDIGQWKTVQISVFRIGSLMISYMLEIGMMYILILIDVSYILSCRGST